MYYLAHTVYCDKYAMDLTRLEGLEEKIMQFHLSPRIIPDYFEEQVKVASANLEESGKICLQYTSEKLNRF